MFRATTPNPVDLALAGFPLVQIAGIRADLGQRTAGINAPDHGVASRCARNDSVWTFSAIDLASLTRQSMVQRWEATGGHTFDTFE
jgi:hypothetical protein